jgi:hypothetical protein
VVGTASLQASAQQEPDLFMQLGNVIGNLRSNVEQNNPEVANQLSDLVNRVQEQLTQGGETG